MEMEYLINFNKMTCKGGINIGKKYNYIIHNVFKQLGVCLNINRKESTMDLKTQRF